jgi:hypothetical protein
MGLLNTPIAQRKGVCISPEDCKIWVEELETFIKNESNVIKDSDPPENI